MKANELIVGDWVLVKELDYNDLTIVTSEYQHQLRLKDFAEAYNAGEYKKYEPIPLTPEILEKNGWEFDELDGDYYNREIHFRVLGGKSPYMIFDGVGISYVHELQHALKLEKIEMRIIL